MISKIQNVQPSPNMHFKGKLPVESKKAIKTFTNAYIKNTDGYVSMKGSIYNGVAILMRGFTGITVTAVLFEQMPKLFHYDISSTAARIATGLGGLAVAFSRIENDRVATGKAATQVGDFVKGLKGEGFSGHDELLYGLKSFMIKKGGFYTSIIPNAVSKKKLENLLKVADSGGLKEGAFLEDNKISYRIKTLAIKKGNCYKSKIKNVVLSKKDKS